MAKHITWAEVESRPRRREPRLSLPDVVWRHKALVLCAVAAALVLGWLHLQRTPRRYQSTAELLLARGGPARGTASADAPAEFTAARLTSTVLRSLQSSPVLGAAIERYHLAALPSLSGQARPAETILANLTLNRLDESPGTSLVELAYRGPQADDCTTILQAVVESYLQHLRQQRQGFSAELTRLLHQAKDELAKQIQEQETVLRKFHADTPALTQATDLIKLHEQRIAQCEETRGLVLKLQRELKPRSETVRAALKQGINHDSLSMLVTALSETDQVANSSRIAFEQQLFAAMLEERKLLLEYGLEHPKVKEVRKTINLLREKLGVKPLGDKADSGDFVATYLGWLEQESVLAVARLKELDARIAEERGEIRQLDQARLMDQQYREGLERTKQLFDVAVKRMVELTVEGDYGGVIAQLVAPPDRATPLQPAWTFVLGLAGGLGLLAGLVLGGVVELASRHFRAAAEWEKQLGVAILGRIPAAPDLTQTKGPQTGTSAALPTAPLCVQHDAQGAAARAYQAAYAGFAPAVEGGGFKIIQVTSPEHGQGKAQLAANLALLAAQAGRRVLLIEADLRHGKFQEYFALPDAPGLGALLAGEAELTAVIRPTAAGNLWVVPAGPRPPQPSDLLVGPRLRQFFEALRPQYDLLLVTTPPALASADASVVSARVDAVLLAIAPPPLGSDAALRCVEIFRGLGKPIVGAVAQAGSVLPAPAGREPVEENG
jgi:capsular exopolysaccharide synthesis family protein